MRRMIPLLALAVLFSVGCKSPFGTTNVSNKYVYFQENSVNLHPLPTIVTEGEYENTDGTVLTFPDGTVMKLTGGGASGNLMLTVNQNDDTGQTTRTDPTTTAEATITPRGGP